MNPGFEHLQPYPFERLSQLLGQVQAPSHLTPIPLSIGEPRHAPFQAALDAHLTAFTESAGKYPSIRGSDSLREACSHWVSRRFGVALDPERMLHPVNGTREGLFAIAQALIDPADRAVVAMPNPFYQIYEGAALMAGAEPVYLNAPESHGYLPDLSQLTPEILARMRVFYLCSPVNPAGSVASLEYLKELWHLAVENDFVLVVDECYIDIYRDQPPHSILNAAEPDFRNTLAFHSLSKRSNLPGLRSGFVAGDAELIRQFAQYRTYHGCSLPVASQIASTVAWSDDDHVAANRDAYNEKFAAAQSILANELNVTTPDAAFYLWPKIPGDDTAFCRALFEQTHVTAVPGQYFGRDVHGINPGAGRIRLSLVAELEQTTQALQRIADFCRHYPACP
ncbi:MAG: succinyldiaminopimelate transaminase [Pseudomonadota bacterium]